MSLRIIKAGVADTIQDIGRYGWQYLGINPTGAMDRHAATIANILAGNEQTTPVIEMHFPASTFLFQYPALIALAGADFSATLNGDVITSQQPVIVNKNCILQFHEPKKGARAYLAINGGFEIPKWLNSYSTHLKARAGGYVGRSLQKDDEILLKEASVFSAKISGKEFFALPWLADSEWGDTSADEVFFLPGNEWDWLTEESKESFMQQEFVITPNSDRMGYRLSSGLLNSKVTEELVSSAVCYGTVQLLPDGRLILLMADHQTTGGYPKVAHVITAHHSKLAQMRPGEKIRFRLTDHTTAETLLWKQQQHLKLLKSACQYRLNEFLNV